MFETVLIRLSLLAPPGTGKSALYNELEKSARRVLENKLVPRNRFEFVRAQDGTNGLVGRTYFKSVKRIVDTNPPPPAEVDVRGNLVVLTTVETEAFFPRRDVMYKSNISIVRDGEAYAIESDKVHVCIKVPGYRLEDNRSSITNKLKRYKIGDTIEFFVTSAAVVRNKLRCTAEYRFSYERR